MSAIVRKPPYNSHAHTAVGFQCKGLEVVRVNLEAVERKQSSARRVASIMLQVACTCSCRVLAGTTGTGNSSSISIKSRYRSGSITVTVTVTS